jgi:hypothetical protein
MAAAMGGNTAVAAELIRPGASLDARDDHRWTALAIAAHTANWKSVTHWNQGERMAIFGALRHVRELLLDPYRTHDLCPQDLCPEASVLRERPSGRRPRNQRVRVRSLAKSLFPGIYFAVAAQMPCCGSTARTRVPKVLRCGLRTGPSPADLNNCRAGGKPIGTCGEPDFARLGSSLDDYLGEAIEYTTFPLGIDGSARNY